MDWKHFLTAVIVTGFVSSLTDWFFGGILFHDKYGAHPEIWRQGPNKSEAPAVAGSIVLGFLTSTAFMTACIVFAVHGYRASLELAGLCWLMVPVPLLVTNALFVKLHPLIVLSHSLGWLAKLGVAAVAAGVLLG
jgi:hypothetical protein